MDGNGRRGKGHNGENEFCKILNVALQPKRRITRNIDQVRMGGADIIAVRPFAIEVKRQETLLLNSWLAQAVSQTTKHNPVPVLAYRQNRKKWNIMLPSWFVCDESFYMKEAFVSVTLEHFLYIVEQTRKSDSKRKSKKSRKSKK